MIENFAGSEIYHSCPYANSRNSRGEGKLILRKVRQVATTPDGETVYHSDDSYEPHKSFTNENYFFTLRDTGKKGGHLIGVDRKIDPFEFDLDIWTIGRAGQKVDLNCDQIQTLDGLKN